ncbi:hypothetical protein EV182_008068 [Spiromyces aspiralis]|uniref:Uncharacterized protein n=1 Tax=Spiromyces aspiralis TaxID=68401 RepID=A0ACC1HQ64_9FUNG|nr:hypothetical protein EV182_008068 [Spiromyces aspiralis]
MAAPPPAQTHRHVPPPPPQPAAAATAAHGPTAAAAPQQPGLFSQMAATAGGVAVGSAIGHTVGHAITGLFGGSGSSSQEAVQQQQQQPAYSSAPVYDQTSTYGNNTRPEACEADLKAFTKCLEEQNDMNACKYYYDMLKNCQAFARNQSL